MPKLADLTPAQRETWDRIMRLFDNGGPDRRDACFTVGITNRDFETHEFEAALLEFSRQSA